MKINKKYRKLPQNKKIIKLMKLKDEEINDLSYNLAIIYDKRNFCEFYSSLLKTKHNLFSSFCNNDDYNSI